MQNHEQHINECRALMADPTVRIPILDVGDAVETLHVYAEEWDTNAHKARLSITLVLTRRQMVILAEHLGWAITHAAGKYYVYYGEEQCVSCDTYEQAQEIVVRGLEKHLQTL